MTAFSWRERRDWNPGTSRCLKYNGSGRIIAIRRNFDGRKADNESKKFQNNPTKEIQSV